MLIKITRILKQKQLELVKRSQLAFGDKLGNAQTPSLMICELGPTFVLNGFFFSRYAPPLSFSDAVDFIPEGKKMNSN